MKQVQVVKLIDGVFDASSAKEIILTMIDKKIEFNQLNSFRNQVTHNVKDSKLEARIKDLKSAKQGIIDFLNNENAKNFKISAEINIESY